MRRLILALAVASATLCAIAACVGDDPTATNTSPTNDAAPAATTTPTATTPPVNDSAPPAVDAGSTCEQRSYPDGAALSYCEDFDDPSRDGGYTTTTFDAGRFFVENGTAFSLPNAVLADPETSSTAQERGGFLHWPITLTNPVRIINVRLKLRPVLDNTAHLHEQGYTDIIRVVVGTSTTILRYTYGRNLINYQDFVGYALITHILPAGVDAGADGEESDAGFTVTPLSAPPTQGNWIETYLEVLTGIGGAMTLQLDGITVATTPIVIAASTDAFVEVGAHGYGIMDAPSSHYIDDVRVDTFK